MRVILLPDVNAGQSLRDLLVDVQDVTGDPAGSAFGGVVVSPETAHTYLSSALGRSASSPDSAAADADPAPDRKAAKKAAPTKTTTAGRNRTARRTGE